MKTSSGVGAGIIVDNELFHGASGTAGEIGHLTLDDQGPLCRCGKRGCLEAYTSTPFIEQTMAGQLPAPTTSTTSSRRPSAGTWRPGAPWRRRACTSAAGSPAS